MEVRFLRWRIGKTNRKRFWFRMAVIKKVGHLDELRNIAGKRVKEYDLRGKCLMPAFIDAHSHITMAGQVSVLADLTECMNYNDIVQKLKSYIKDHHVNRKTGGAGVWL